MAPAEDVSDELGPEGGPAVEEAPRLNLEVAVAAPSTCQRHITVKVPHDDVERYFGKTLAELVPKASVPGFREGRAPRKLVEQRFRKDLKDQVRAALLSDCVNQVIEDQKFAAISEPDFDAGAIELPEDGPLTFEFKLEVRPEFDLPEWKGLEIERPIRQISEQNINKRLEQLLGQYGKLVPFDGPAEVGDYITCNLSFRGDSGDLSKSREEVLRIRPVLSFRDGKIEGFDKLMRGVRGGETREGKALLSMDAPNAALRGRTIAAVFEVLEVKKLQLPRLTPQFLDELGEFESEDELREAVREHLEEQLVFHQRQHARRQITAALTRGANWDLPPDMLKRQSRREMDRAVLELRREGFSEPEIRAHENELRQNNAVNTARAIKEHFILERIADEEKIDADEEDYKQEIEQIAERGNQSPRSVKSRLEKGGLMDALRNQIVERKVIEHVLSFARFRDVSYQPAQAETEALDQAAGGGEDPEHAIPEATQPNEAQPLRPQADRS